MKVLVALKRVADPDNANKVKIAAGGNAVDTSGLEWKPNPFDEYALEAALRLTENGKAPKQRLGEVVVVSIGPKEVEQTLRAALATGADRAIRVDATDDQLDGRLVAGALKALIDAEKPDLVLMGKQAIDGDNNAVGQMLAALLDWPQATFASEVELNGETSAKVTREVDGGLQTLEVDLPAVVTADLRLNEPSYASLPNIMKAKKKPIEVKPAADYGLDIAPRLKVLKVTEPPKRGGGIKVETAADLVMKLKNEAGVL